MNAPRQSQPQRSQVTRRAFLSRLGAARPPLERIRQALTDHGAIVSPA